MNEAETMSLWGVITASLTLIKTKIMDIAFIIRRIVLGSSEIEVELAKATVMVGENGLKLSSMNIDRARNILTANNIRLKIMERLETVKNTVSTLKNTLVKTYDNVQEELSTTLSLRRALAKGVETLAENSNTFAIIMNTASKLKDIAITIAVLGVIGIKTIYTIYRTF